MNETPNLIHLDTLRFHSPYHFIVKRAEWLTEMPVVPQNCVDGEPSEEANSPKAAVPKDQQFQKI
jgi:hypothetical protein